MLLSGLTESTKNEIEWHSQDEDVVKLFLQLLYEGKVDLPKFSEYAIPLFQLAHQYQVDSIMDLCETFLIRNMCPKDAIEIFGVAKLLGSADLIYTAFKCVQRYVIMNYDCCF